MSQKFRNPPVIYAVAKLNYAGAIGNYTKGKYQRLLDHIEHLGFDSFIESSVQHVEDDQDSSSLGETISSNRVGFFSPDKTKSLVLNEKSIEYCISDYTNHTDLIEGMCKAIRACNELDITTNLVENEVELHYVDLFIPRGLKALDEMFNGIQLPNSQFYSSEKDAIKVGITSFMRVLEGAKDKISISLEQSMMLDGKLNKVLPRQLLNRDLKLRMPINTDRLLGDYDGKTYALVHTACAGLLGEREVKINDLYEMLYNESRSTFDEMVNFDKCSKLWEPIDR